MHVVPAAFTGSSATSLAMVHIYPSMETTCFLLVPNMPDEGTKDAVCMSCSRHKAGIRVKLHPSYTAQVQQPECFVRVLHPVSRADVSPK